MIGLNFSTTITNPQTLVSISNGFAKIDTISNQPTYTTIYVKFFVQFDPDNLISPFYIGEYSVPLNVLTDTSTLAVYQHLQTLPDFEGSTFVE